MATAPPALTPYPAEGSDRLFAAIERCRYYLSEEAAKKLQEVWADKYALWTFAVLIAVFAGLQVTPAGPAANIIMVLLGVAQGLKDIGLLVVAAKRAWSAPDEKALNAASAEIAAAISTIGVDLILAVLGNALFRQLTRLLRFTVRAPRALAEPPIAEPQAKPKTAAEPATPREPTPKGRSLPEPVEVPPTQRTSGAILAGAGALGGAQILPRGGVLTAAAFLAAAISIYLIAKKATP